MAGPEDDDPFASWFDEGDTGALVRPEDAADPDDGFELPDWSAPPTGQVPAVVSTGQHGPVTGPVYRGESQTRGDEAPMAFDDLADTHLRVGALDDAGIGPEDDPYLSDNYSIDPADQPTSVAERPGSGAGPSTEATPSVPPSAGAPPAPRPRAQSEAPRPGVPAGRSQGAPGPGRRPPGGGVAAPPPPPQQGTDARRPQGRQPAEPSGDLQRPRTRPPEANADGGRPSPMPRRRAPEPASGERNLPQAIMVGLGLVAVGVAAFALGQIPAMILIVVVLGLAGTEMMGALHRGGYTPAGLVGLAGIVGLVIGAYQAGSAAYPIVLGLTILAGLLWYLFVSPGDQPVQNLGATMLGMLYVGGLGSFASLLIGLGRISPDGKGGAWLLFGAVVAAVTYDTAGYFIGKTMGASPLGGSLRAISPNKTQEGLLGGVVVSILVTFVYLTVTSPALLGSEGFSTRTALFAVLCPLAAPLGDLSESLLKRDLQIKDMGTLLPAHGGILDRFDALLFVLPVAYFVTVTGW